jgi:probable phosphoglycerate mutase
LVSADPPPTRLVLIRHGESKVTVERVIGGFRTCTGLSDLGRQQAKRLRDRLAETSELSADALYASNFARARETAEIIAPALGGLDVLEEAGFGEHDPGPDCDGMTFDAFIERYGTGHNWEDPFAESFPGGETIAAFHHRVGVAAYDVLQRHAGQTIVVCCHGGVVNALIRQFLRMPPTGSFELQNLAGLPLETARD